MTSSFSFGLIQSNVNVIADCYKVDITVIKIRCQASPVTKRVPVRDSTLKHMPGLTEYWASHYDACLPLPTCRIRFAFAVYL